MTNEKRIPLRQKLTKKWLSVWLYVILIPSVAITIALICNWNVWDFETRIFVFSTILLPIHVWEEWRIPGGFHTMYNLMDKSDHPDRYPMNQLSDMWTNFIGVIFGCIVMLVGVNHVFAVMQCLVCLGEIFGHFSGGVFTLKKFKDKGKKTIYNPGLFTTIFGWIPILAAFLYSFIAISHPLWWQILLGIVCGMILGTFSLNIMEKICKDENTPYAFTWGDGYFTKFLDEAD